MDAETLCLLSLTELAARLRAKELSSVEVTRTILDRIRQANPHHQIAVNTRQRYRQHDQ